MATTKTVIFLSGILNWVKVLGAPRLNYSEDALEWAFEIEPDEASLQKIIKAGLSDRIKGRGYNPGTKGQHKDREPFIQLKKSELTKDGRPNPPIRVLDENDGDWAQDKLIGNGSAGDVKLDIRDYGPGKKKGVYPVAIRVTDHVAYQSSEFGSMDKESPSAGKVAAKEARAAEKVKTLEKDFELEVEDLDDDVPF